MTRFDVLVVGSGVAGLSAAVRLARVRPRPLVALLTKGALADSTTRWAQGGVAAVLRGETAADLARCREAGVDVVFAPAPAELYPPGCQTWVEVGELARGLCGASRPGHFRGVATGVTKLLLAAKPHVAVFGEKDFQQLAVVRRLVRDLCLDVQIVGAPIVREADGLALSSRNANLDPEARRQAPCLARALDAAERAVAAGETGRARLLRLGADEIAKAPRAEVDYAELRDPETLAPAPEPLAGPALLALAVRFRAPDGGAGVRLIDNRLLGR